MRPTGPLYWPTTAVRKSRRHYDLGNAERDFMNLIDEERHWIEAGRCYERLALQADALGLRTAFINQPVEVPRLRSQFATFLGIGSRRPDLIVRIGRGPDMPRTLRRPVEEVIYEAMKLTGMD